MKNRSYNIGSQLIDTEYACFIDLDCIIHPRQVETARDSAKANSNIGTIQPYNGTALYLKTKAKKAFTDSHCSYDSLQFTLPSGQPLYTNYSNEDFLVGNTQAPGGCFMCRMDTFRAFNGFNPNFKGWGYEDNEFLKRLHILGYDVCKLAGKSQVLWHLPHEGVDQSNKADHPHYDDNRDICSFIVSCTKDELEGYIKTW